MSLKVTKEAIRYISKVSNPVQTPLTKSSASNYSKMVTSVTQTNSFDQPERKISTLTTVSALSALGMGAKAYDHACHENDKTLLAAATVLTGIGIALATEARKEDEDLYINRPSMVIVPYAVYEDRILFEARQRKEKARFDALQTKQLVTLDTASQQASEKS